MVDYPVIRGVRCGIVVCDTPVFVLIKTEKEDSDQLEIDLAHMISDACVLVLKKAL